MTTPTKKKIPISKMVTKRKTPLILLNNFKEVFNASLDELGVPALHYGRQRAVATMYNISVSAARKWLTGQCLPDTDNLIMLADSLGYTVDMLLGRVPLVKKGKSVAIEVMRIDTSGKEISDGVVQFDDVLLDASMRMKHNSLEIHIVATDSMIPSFNVDDKIFVDTSITQLEDNKVYLFVTNDSRVVIRRVLLGIDDTVTLLADNTNYQPIQVKKDDIKIGSPKGRQKTHVLRVIGLIPWAIQRVTNKTK